MPWWVGTSVSVSKRTYICYHEMFADAELSVLYQFATASFVPVPLLLS